MANEMYVSLMTQRHFLPDKKGNYNYEGSLVQHEPEIVDREITLAEFEQLVRSILPSLGAKPLRMRYLFPVADGIRQPVDIINDEHLNNFKKFASTTPKPRFTRVFIDPVGEQGDDYQPGIAAVKSE